METPPSPIEPEGMLDGIQWGKVASGAALDLLATWVVSVPLVLWLAGGAALGDDEEAAERAIDQAVASPEFLWLGAVVGLGITAAVAFWVARRAADRHVLHGGWTAVASVLLGFALSLVTGDAGTRPPFWYEALGYAQVVPTGMAGGWLAAKAEPPSAGGGQRPA